MSNSNTLDQELSAWLERHRKSVKEELGAIYNQWSNGEIMNAYVTGNYYRLKADYYKHQNPPSETSERVKRKINASLEELAEMNKLIQQFGHQPIAA
ncbi:hypothetical protein J4218_01020 [Candidatus Pacearchaeota archaeon]|nr:hypothetical protein [Candidatus Pacearchaeota archaeon]